MTFRHFPPFRLERWFAEFKFISGMRNLAASGPFAVTTRELLELEDAETTARYLDLGLDYIENPGSESLRRAIASLYTTLKAEDVQVTLGASEALLLLVWTMEELWQLSSTRYSRKQLPARRAIFLPAICATCSAASYAFF